MLSPCLPYKCPLVHSNQLASLQLRLICNLCPSPSPPPGALHQPQTGRDLRHDREAVAGHPQDRAVRTAPQRPAQLVRRPEPWPCIDTCTSVNMCFCHCSHYFDLNVTLNSTDLELIDVNIEWVGVSVPCSGVRVGRLRTMGFGPFSWDLNTILSTRLPCTPIIRVLLLL